MFYFKVESLYFNEKIDGIMSLIRQSRIDSSMTEIKLLGPAGDLDAMYTHCYQHLVVWE